MNAPSPLPAAAELLPGGLVTEGGLARDYAFVPADGALELALGEVAPLATSTPQAVSLTLVAALHSVAGGVASRERVDGLCVADRQFLMRQLARHLGDEGGWFDACCGACGAHFDFRLDYRDLPVKPAGPDFPRTSVRLGRRSLTLRVPTGADQLRLLDAPAAEREIHLLGALLDRFDGLELARGANADERRRLEATLEEIAPAVCTEVAAPCPECGHVTRVGIDPYGVLARSSDDLLGDIHRLASNYHWSEAEILALPRLRRQRYLQLIDRSRGLTQ
ncbi:MAG: hypothetical protein KAY13_01165 [Zoogloea sp.]|nr:hypothetical protein [Zoogloea sp.]